MSDMMTFPPTVEEFMEQYKIVDDEKVYTNGADLVPIFRMMQWFEHVSAMDTISRHAAINAIKDRYYKYGRTAKKDELIYALERVPHVQLGTNLASLGTDCISRQAAINEIERAKVRIYHSIERAIGRSIIEILDDVEKDIRGLPSEDPKKGRWKYNNKIGTFKIFTCDQCGWNSEAEFNYCPNCGAKMEGEQDG